MPLIINHFLRSNGWQALALNCLFFHIVKVTFKQLYLYKPNSQLLSLTSAKFFYNQFTSNFITFFLHLFPNLNDLEHWFSRQFTFLTSSQTMQKMLYLEAHFGNRISGRRSRAFLFCEEEKKNKLCQHIIKQWFLLFLCC